MTAYLKNGGTLEKAAMANHASQRATALACVLEYLRLVLVFGLDQALVDGPAVFAGDLLLPSVMVRLARVTVKLVSAERVKLHDS